MSKIKRTSGKECYLIDNISFLLFVCLFHHHHLSSLRHGTHKAAVCMFTDIFNLEMILLISMKESSFSRTLNSIFLILSLNDFFGSSLRELGISFHSLAPILEKVFFVFQVLKLLCKDFLKQKNVCCKNGHWTFL